jgi:ornithine cyclodeaminase/alanine dehydrogenase-like protein (mu-crystallin family)
VTHRCYNRIIVDPKNASPAILEHDMAQPLLLLSASDVVALLDPAACLDAVERAFRLLGEGSAAPPALCGQHVEGGVFHVKAAVLADEHGHPWFAAKVNANFPGNPRQRSLPTVQGAVLLMDGSSGEPRALLDSAAITALRTAAATGVAARWLAPAGATTVTLAGCGVQGRAHLPFLVAALPRLRRVRLYDPDVEAQRAAVAVATALGLDAEPVADLAAACRTSEVCVTCTPSRRPLLDRGDVAPGALVAGVGADNENKHELAPALLAAATVVTDLLAQCALVGDLHHALEAGALRREDVHADLGEVVAGRRPGRRSREEIVVFDSTGLAVQDVAAAMLVYERALAAGRGVPVGLAS